MSDYLSNLLERSFAPALKVRPQIPSIFERPSAPAFVESPTESTPPGAGTAAPHFSRTDPTISVAPRASQPNKAPDHDESPHSAPSPSPLQPSAHPTEITAALHPASPRLSHTIPRNEAAASAIQAPTAPLASSSNAASPRNPESSDSIASPLQRFSNIPAPSGMVIHPPGAKDATAIHATVRSHRKESERSPSPAASAPTPSIQVTIGRIEVRATTTTAAPRTASRREPEMSLASYLQHRANGGRS